MTDHVLIIHDVEDYDRWKAIFDDAAGIRAAAGELRFQVLSCAEDAARIVHFSQWTSVDAARRFFESPELVALRQAAGVRSPAFLYLQNGMPAI